MRASRDAFADGEWLAADRPRFCASRSPPMSIHPLYAG